MSNASRVTVTILVALVVVGVLIDPYTYNRTASDVLEWPPWWQLLFVLIDLILLGVILRSAWIGDARRAWRALIGETTYHVAIAILFILRDGIERFIWGIGAQEIVSRFLLFVLIRMVALYILVVSVERQLGHRDVAAGNRAQAMDPS